MDKLQWSLLHNQGKYVKGYSHLYSVQNKCYITRVYNYMESPKEYYHREKESLEDCLSRSKNTTFKHVPIRLQYRGYYFRSLLEVKW
jgi:hypothetical protein